MEAGLFMQPWDFDPSLVNQEVRFWHGAQDTRIPASVATSFAERMPHASATIWPHHGHFSWATSDDIKDVTAFLTEIEGQKGAKA